MKEVAIVGFADTRVHAPKDIEVWSLNEAYTMLDKFDRIFEIHPKKWIKDSKRNPKHWEWLQNSPVPVYMQETHKDIPQSVKYPKDEMIEKHGERFGSSIDYMMALAIEEGYEKISLYGVDMAMYTEYTAQRPTLMYFIGYAEASGIEVWIHPDSGMNKKDLYGYRETDKIGRYILKIDELVHIQDKLVGEINYTQGVIATLEEVGLEDGAKVAKDSLGKLNGLYEDAEKERFHYTSLIKKVSGNAVMVSPSTVRVMPAN